MRQLGSRDVLPLAQLPDLHANRRRDGERRIGAGRTAPIGSAEILPGRPADISAHNALLARYETAFTALMPP